MFARQCNSHEGVGHANSVQEHGSTSLSPDVLKQPGHSLERELDLDSSLQLMVLGIFECFRIRSKYIAKINTHTLRYVPT